VAHERARAQLRQQVPRQVDGEDAPQARQIANAENAVVRLDAAPADCEAKSQA
jgi:hypothetical protein